MDDIDTSVGIPIEAMRPVPARTLERCALCQDRCVEDVRFVCACGIGICGDCSLRTGGFSCGADRWYCYPCHRRFSHRPPPRHEVCRACDQPISPDRAPYMPCAACDVVVGYMCARTLHIVMCQCGHDLCEDCHELCSVCQRPTCEDCSRVCDVCGDVACTECVEAVTQHPYLVCTMCMDTISM